jgi:hypothetical protein
LGGGPSTRFRPSREGTAAEASVWGRGRGWGVGEGGQLKILEASRRCQA